MQLVSLTSGGAAKPFLYKVKAGDTLAKIAFDNSCTVAELKAKNPHLANEADDADLLGLGITKIRLPTAKKKNPNQHKFSFKNSKNDAISTIQNSTGETDNSFTYPSYMSEKDREKERLDREKRKAEEPQEPPFDWWALVDAVADIIVDVLKDVTGISKIEAVYNLAVAIIEGDEKKIKDAALDLVESFAPPFINKLRDVYEWADAAKEAIETGNLDALKDKAISSVIEKGTEKFTNQLNQSLKNHDNHRQKLLQENDPQNANIVIPENKNKEYKKASSARDKFQDGYKIPIQTRPAKTETPQPESEKIEIKPTETRTEIKPLPEHEKILANGQPENNQNANNQQTGKNENQRYITEDEANDIEQQYQTDPKKLSKQDQDFVVARLEKRKKAAQLKSNQEKLTLRSDDETLPADVREALRRQEKRVTLSKNDRTVILEAQRQRAQELKEAQNVQPTLIDTPKEDTKTSEKNDKTIGKKKVRPKVNAKGTAQLQSRYIGTSAGSGSECDWQFENGRIHFEGINPNTSYVFVIHNNWGVKNWG